MKEQKRFLEVDLNKVEEVEGKPPKIYKFDRYIFLGVVAVSLIFAITIIISAGGFDANKYLYVECKTYVGGYCENPLFNNTAYCGKSIDVNAPICTNSLLPNGFIAGRKPPAIISIFGTITAILVCCGFVVNHYLYNRGVL